MTRAVLIGGMLLAFAGLAYYVALKQSDINDRHASLDPQEKLAIAAVEKLDGYVLTEPNAKNFRPIVRASLSGRAVTDADLKEFAGLTRLEELDLSGTRVTDEGLKELNAFPLLNFVNLSRTGITGNGLVHLKDHLTLSKISLARSAVTDAGLSGLSGVPLLRELNLSGTGITNAGLVHLKTLTNLESLILAETKVTGQGVASLTGLGLYSVDLSGISLSADEYATIRDARTRFGIPLLGPGGTRRKEKEEEKLDVRWSRTTISDEWLTALAAKGKLDLLVESSVRVLYGSAGVKPESKLGMRILALTETKVTDAGLRSLRGFDKFTSLDVGVTAIGDAGLAEIAEHHTLTNLYLDSTRLTDAGLKHLERMKSLRYLNLGATGVTAAGIKSLKAALPDCEIDSVARSQPSGTGMPGAGGPGEPGS